MSAPQPHRDYAPPPAFLLRNERTAEVVPIHDATPEAESIAFSLDKLAEDINRNRLDEIAVLVRALTYGEMMELAQGIWRLRPDGDELSQTDLPGMFHKWSKDRK